MEINNIPKKILAVHTGGICDIVMLGPSLRLLREAYAEGTTIDLLVSPTIREIAERYPYINNIICLDTAALKRELMQFNEISSGLKLFFELRRKKYDIAIIFQPILSPFSMFRLSFFMAIIRPKKIFGRKSNWHCWVAY
jgi:ADP-heptose:LPS heptosyltransferase